MVGLSLMVTSVRRFGDRTTPGAVRFAAASIVARAAREAGGGLLEPMMNTEVITPEAHVGTILNDLTANRRAEIRSVDAPGTTNSAGSRRGSDSNEVMVGGRRGAQGGAKGRSGSAGPRGVGGRHEVRVRVPLRELLGYATTLRSLSAGEASFTMELAGYARMDGDIQRTVLEEGW